MNVLILFPRFGIGGIAKASSFVANTLIKRGYKVICVSMSDDQNMLLFEDGIEQAYIPYEKKGNISFYNKVFFIFRLRKMLVSKKINVAIVLGTDLVRIMALSSLLLNITLIGSERGNPYMYTDKEKKKYTWALSRCSKVVFQTPEARAFYPIEIQNNSTIIPNPCYKKGNGTIIKTDLSKKVILVVSRISEEKNVIGIVKAFDKAYAEISDYELHIYGDGNKKDEVIDYVKNKKIKGVKFYPNAVNPFEIEPGAFLYVINSVTEGMPNSLIEAMMYGIPCVASDCPPGGVRFLSDNGRRVCLVPVKDNGKLSEAMIKVIKDDTYRNRLIHAASEIEKELDPNLIGQKWVSLINE